MVIDILSLPDFCRKVSIFMRANPNAVLEPDIAALFDQYAQILAEQGLLVTAAKYVKSSSELKDRLYRSRDSPQCLAAMGGRPPDFPFDMLNVAWIYDHLRFFWIFNNYDKIISK